MEWVTFDRLQCSTAAITAAHRSAEAEQAGWVRPLARLAPVVALLYNIAFLTTGGILRPAAGVLMLLVILAFGFWGFTHTAGRAMSVPRLGILAGLATSVIGAVLGVLLGVYIANPDSGLTPLLAGAHPATMVVGFLVPVGMAYAEAAGLPPITGLYATLVPLTAYALFGPSRILVLGPDSSLAGIIAAVVLPLAAGDPARAVALAGMLAIITGFDSTRTSTIHSRFGQSMP